MNREQQRLLAHLKTAKAYAELSYARRLKVGAVLIKDDRVLSVGYNGMPSGMDNSCETVLEMEGLEDWENNPKLWNAVLTTKPGLVHAEMNVIAFAAKNGVSTNQCIMIITHSPCFDCSKLIVQAGITKVYYETEYRITEGIDFLRECGVRVEKVNNDTNQEVGTAETT